METMHSQHQALQTQLQHRTSNKIKPNSKHNSAPPLSILLQPSLKPKAKATNLRPILSRHSSIQLSSATHQPKHLQQQPQQVKARQQVKTQQQQQPPRKQQPHLHRTRQTPLNHLNRKTNRSSPSPIQILCTTHNSSRIFFLP